MAVFYFILPIGGGFLSRYRWKRFRSRFDELRIAPLLDYRQYRQLDDDGGIFRFTGGIESITDGQTLWVKGEDLTISVSLKKTQCWLLPIHEGEGIPEAPEQIRWNRISTLTEGAKVYIGGQIKVENNRSIFVSTKEKPLMVIFYNCPDTALTGAIIRAARTRNEYWNSSASIFLSTGAMVLIYIAAMYLNRTAFRLTVITALVATFVPILPVFPPGFLFTIMYRRLSWNARILRANWDLVRLPARFLPQDCESASLTTGEKYGYKEYISLPGKAEDGEIPFLIPELTKPEGKKTQWRIFGVLEDDASAAPVSSKDPFVSFGILPGSPRQLARRYAIKAYSMETFAWFVLLLGIGINIVFIFLILSLFGIVSF